MRVNVICSELLSSGSNENVEVRICGWANDWKHFQTKKISNGLNPVENQEFRFHLAGEEIDFLVTNLWESAGTEKKNTGHFVVSVRELKREIYVISSLSNRQATNKSHVFGVQIHFLKGTVICV